MSSSNGTNYEEGVAYGGGSRGGSPTPPNVDILAPSSHDHLYETSNAEVATRIAINDTAASNSPLNDDEMRFSTSTSTLAGDNINIQNDTKKAGGKIDEDGSFDTTRTDTSTAAQALFEQRLKDKASDSSKTAKDFQLPPEHILDDNVPQSPPSMSADPLAKSDLMKKIASNDRPELIDDNIGPDDRPASMGVGSPQDSSILKKIAESQSSSPKEEESKKKEAILSDGESIVICKSQMSGAWFLRESARDPTLGSSGVMSTSPSSVTGSSCISRAPAWGRWIPVTLRRHAMVENWQKLKSFDFYLIPTKEEVERSIG